MVESIHLRPSFECFELSQHPHVVAVSMVRVTFFAITLLGVVQAIVVKRQANGCDCVSKIIETYVKYANTYIVIRRDNVHSHRRCRRCNPGTEWWRQVNGFSKLTTMLLMKLYISGYPHQCSDREVKRPEHDNQGFD